MKILILNDYGTPTGGSQIMSIHLRDELRRRGHDARLFASRAQLRSGKFLADYNCFGTSSRFKTLLETFNPWAFLKLKQILNDFRPDVVHVRMFLTQFSPLILPLLRDVPSLYNVETYKAICPLATKMLPNGNSCRVQAGVACYQNHCLPLHSWLVLMLQRQLWLHWRKFFNVIVASSHAVKHRLIAEGIEPVEVIWYGIPVKSQRPPLSSPPSIVFAGRLVREKGVDVLIHAFAKVITQIPDAKLHIAGEGSERQYLNTLINRLKLSASAIMLGHVLYSDIDSVFNKAWVQVVPSRWEEPFGIVAIEAMMRGTAVVASGSGGLSEIVQNGQTGILVPPGDPDALAAALIQILQNRNLAEQMGRSGRDFALEHFNITKTIDKFIELYESLCHSKKAPNSILVTS